MANDLANKLALTKVTYIVTNLANNTHILTQTIKQLPLHNASSVFLIGFW